MSNETLRSAGHICFTAEGQEFYELGGEVYRAKLDSVMDVQAGARIGRWECTRAQFDRYREMLAPSAPAPLGFDKLTQYRVCLLEDGRQLAVVTSTSAFEAECSLLRERGYDYYTLEVVYARPVGPVSFWHPALPEVAILAGSTASGRQYVDVMSWRQWRFAIVRMRRAQPKRPTAGKPVGWTRPAASGKPAHLLLDSGEVACGAQGFAVLGHRSKPSRFEAVCGRCNRSRHLDGRWPGFGPVA